LVEVAGKALSPGINDPMTAMSCVNWLTSSLIYLGGRHVPSAARHDSDGALRVVAPPISYAEFAGAVFTQLRPYVETDRNAALHMMDAIARAAYHVRSPDRARVLLCHAEDLNEGCQANLSHQQDRDAVAARLKLVVERLTPVLR